MLTQIMLTEIELELKNQVSRLDKPQTKNYFEMLTYHLGWSGEGAGPAAGGKRIRPLLVLLTLAAAGDSGTWKSGLPAAAAVELIHNFSLVHDDIQDHSPKRRGRNTVWVNWGIPQAINAGDGLFILSNLAMLDLHKVFPAETVMRAADTLQNTCLDLTRGQYLDMSYEKRVDLGMEDYWPMVTGKTAALLSGCCALGAILASADEHVVDAYRSFGHYLGLAFQVQDDILGIWGNEAMTGKSTASDLVEGKKSLPVLAGLEKKGNFAERWKKGPILQEEVEEIARELAAEGIYSYANDIAIQLTDLALNNLKAADPAGEAGIELMNLTNQLTGRNS